MRNPILDDIAKLMTDAAGVAQGMRKEFETSMAGLLERWLADQEIPTREEVEALRESVRRLDEERESVAARIAVLEAELAATRASGPAKKTAKRAKKAEPSGPVERETPIGVDSAPDGTESESPTGDAADAGPAEPPTEQGPGGDTNGTGKSEPA